MMMQKLTVAILVLLVAAPVWAQPPVTDAELWRTFASRIEVGSRVKLRLRDGKRLSATLIQAGADDLVVQPRTRVPIAIRHVPYEAIAAIERDQTRGIGAGKAAAIGVATGIGAFFATFLFVLAAFD
jgi:hypothetical protein